MSAQALAPQIGVEVKTVQDVIAGERRKGMPIAVHGTGRSGDPFRYSILAAP